MSLTNKNTNVLTNVNRATKSQLQNKKIVDNTFSDAYNESMKENKQFADNFYEPISKKPRIYTKKKLHSNYHVKNKHQNNNNLLKCWVYINSKEKTAAENYLKSKQLDIDIKQEEEVDVVNFSETEDNELPTMTTRNSVRQLSTVLHDENNDNDDSNNKKSKIKELENENKKEVVSFKLRSRKPFTYIPYETKLKVIKLYNKHPDWSLKELRKQSGCSAINDRHQICKWIERVKICESRPVKKKKIIPLDMKIKVVNMAKKHPDWTIKTLQEKTGCLIDSRKQINLWIKHIQTGGTIREKTHKIYKWVYDKCMENKKQNNKTKITKLQIIEWSYEAHKLLFPNVPIKYKNTKDKRKSWIIYFTKHYPDYQVSDDEENDKLNKKNTQNIKNIVKKKRKNNSTNKLEPVSDEDKIKIIKLMNENPNWSIKKIRKNSGCSKVYFRKQVLSWNKTIKNGSLLEKRHARDRLVYEKCKQYTKNVKKTFDKNLLFKWAKEANNTIKLSDSSRCLFSIGDRWLTKFRRLYKIVGYSPNLQLSNEFDESVNKNKIINTVLNKKIFSNDVTNNIDNNDTTSDINNIDSNVLTNKLNRKPKYFASYDEKIKVLNTFKKNPGITIKDLQQKTGCKYVYTINQLNRWANDIKIGGSLRNKLTKICHSVYAKCIEQRDKNEKITYNLLRKWATEAYNKMSNNAKKNMKFCASKTWIINFKKNYGIFGLSTDLKIGDLPSDNNFNFDNNYNEKSSESVKLIKPLKPVKPAFTKTPLKTAIEIVNLSYKHPDWDLKELRKNSGYNKLRNFNQILRWEKIIKNSKTFSKKCELMDRWILDKCIEYKNENYLITDKIIIGWALEAKRIFCNLSANHYASVPWLNNFKLKNKISGESKDLRIRN